MMNRSFSQTCVSPPHPAASHRPLWDDSSTAEQGGGLNTIQLEVGSSDRTSICPTDWALALIADPSLFTQSPHLSKTDGIGVDRKFKTGIQKRQGQKGRKTF